MAIKLLLTIFLTIKLALSSRFVFLSREYRDSSFTNEKRYFSNITFSNETDQEEDERFGLWGNPKINNDEFGTFSLDRTPAQIGVDRYFYKSISKDGELLEWGKRMYINFTLSDKAVSQAFRNIDRNSYFKQENPYHYPWDVECSYETFPFTFNVDYDTSFSGVSKVVSWGGLTFGYLPSKKSVYVINITNYRTSSISIEDYFDIIQEDRITTGRDVVDLFLVNQFYLDYAYLGVLYTDQLVLYKLTGSSNGIDATISSIRRIRVSVFNSPKRVTRIGALDSEMIVIASLDQGLSVVRSYPSTSNTARSKQSKRVSETWRLHGVQKNYYFGGFLKTDLAVKDMVVLNSTIYILVEGYGLKILNSSPKTVTGGDCFDYYEDLNFIFPNLYQLDYYYNYLTNVLYVGILRSENNSVDKEIFFEISLYKGETSPRFNKVFLTPNPVYPSEIASEMHYSFFLDKNENTMYIFRRGLVYPINELSYITPLTSNGRFNTNKAENVRLVSTYDYGLRTLGISLLPEKFGLMILNMFDMQEDKMKCRFNKEGDYRIWFNSQAEVCSESKEFKNSYCAISINNPITSVLKITPYLRTLNIVMGVLFSIIGIGFIITIIKCTHCFTNDCRKDYHNEHDNLYDYNTEINQEEQSQKETSSKKNLTRVITGDVELHSVK